MTTLIRRKRSEGNRKVETRTLTADEISAKQLTLIQTPTDSSSVVVDLPCGTVQVKVIDFTVTGTILEWDSKGLETILEIGEKIIITYNVTG